MSLFTMQLMDVISPGRVRRPRVKLDTIQSKIEVIKPKKVVDTLANHHGCCENMADSCCATGSGSGCSHAADTVSASTNGMIDVIGNGGGGSSTLVWAIVAVLFALALCFYFVLLYRRSLATPRIGR